MFLELETVFIGIRLLEASFASSFDLDIYKRKVLLAVKNIAIGWSCSGWDIFTLLMGDNGEGYKCSFPFHPYLDTRFLPMKA